MERTIPREENASHERGQIERERQRSAARRRPREGGFTLIELLVVMVILALLAGLVGPRILDQLGGAKSKTAEVQVENFAAALDLYRLDVGNYPSDSEGLEALIEQPSGVESWRGPYLNRSEVPQDPWGRDYLYRFPGEQGAFDLYSLGADGQEGGDGEDADVTSWQ